MVACWPWGAGARHIVAASMATARDRHYDTRSVRLVTGLGVAMALPQPCKNMTLTRGEHVKAVMCAGMESQLSGLGPTLSI
jgi:hypothetical protein